MSYVSTRWLLLLGLGHLSNKNKFTIEYRHCYNANRIQISSVHYTCLPRDSLESVTAYAVNVVPTSGTRVSSMPCHNGSFPPFPQLTDFENLFIECPLSVHHTAKDNGHAGRLRDRLHFHIVLPGNRVIVPMP